MRSYREIFLMLVWAILFFFSCAKEAVVDIQTDAPMQVPIGFPMMDMPIDNGYTFERWQLGKKLFYDKRMSKSNTISCASCHKASLAFSDDVPLSIGDNNEIGLSNAPSLTNIGYHPYFTRAGGVPTLEMQVLVPVQEHNEFNNNIVDLAKLFDLDVDYHEAAMRSYGRAFDPFVLVRAISNFERSFISGNSKYDQYHYQDKRSVMSASELRGLALFNSARTNCSSCHADFNFTNYAFDNNGLYEVYADNGRMRLTKLESDRSLFKVPSLRNIEVTAPYMHDGSISSLEGVIDHYNSGGKTFKNKSVLIRPLGLSKVEKQDLVSFLKTLTDHQFIDNKNLKNE